MNENPSVKISFAKFKILQLKKGGASYLNVTERSVPDHLEEDRQSIFENRLLHMSLYRLLVETDYTWLRSSGEYVPRLFLPSYKPPHHTDSNTSVSAIIFANWEHVQCCCTVVIMGVAFRYIPTRECFFVKCSSLLHSWTFCTAKISRYTVLHISFYHIYCVEITKQDNEIKSHCV